MVNHIAKNSKKLPRGIRISNPGNIERNSTRWQGMSDDQSGDPRFVVFSHPKWGVRAIARVLITYQDKRRANDGSRIDTIKEIVERWAPPHENNTSAYSDFVAARVNLAVDEKLDVYDYDLMQGLVKAIITMENGMQPYDQATINAGLRLAGIEVPAKPMGQSRTIKASTLAATATAATAIIDQVETAKEVITPLVPYVDVAKYAMIALTLVAVAVVVWARIDDANSDVRP